jgi:hypothetical protein
MSRGRLLGHERQLQMTNDPVFSAASSMASWRLRGLHIGASERDRTSDLLITNQLLYRLSYAG